MKTMGTNYNTSTAKFEALMPPGRDMRILDVGSGDGELLQPYVSGHEVHGIDVSATAVSQAMKRGVRAQVADAQHRFPFDDKYFDVVLALDILEHLQDPFYALTEAWRVTKPDGCLIAALPNHFDLRTRWQILTGRGLVKWSQRQFTAVPWDYEHIRFLTLKEFRALLVAAGWYPERWQFNFMSGGIPPQWLLPAAVKTWCLRLSPGLWSGKFVVCCRKQKNAVRPPIYLPTTPEDF